MPLASALPRPLSACGPRALAIASNSRSRSPHFTLSFTLLGTTRLRISDSLMEGDAGVNASSEGLAGVAHVAKHESKT